MAYFEESADLVREDTDVDFVVRCLTDHLAEEISILDLAELLHLSYPGVL